MSTGAFGDSVINDGRLLSLSPLGLGSGTQGRSEVGGGRRRDHFAYFAEVNNETFYYYNIWDEQIKKKKSPEFLLQQYFEKKKTLTVFIFCSGSKIQ